MKKIPLTQGKYAIVDNADFSLLNQFKWCLLHTYAARTKYKPKKTVLLHRVILNNPVGMEIDHINGDGLDNRRKNLRIVSHQQNLFNRRSNKNSSSVYRGVSWSKSNNKWHAFIQKNGVLFHLGHYSSEREAAMVYNKKAKELFGEFARLNPV